MKTEIQHAVTFLVDTLKDKLSNEEKIHTLRTRLTYLLAERYENHWYVDKPLKGSAFRCINISIEDKSIDVALRRAANESGLSEETLFGVFCNGLALWIDPDDVSGRIGKGSIFPIYKKIADNRTVVAETTSSGGIQHRRQQRPRSMSPPQSHVSSPAPEIIPSSRPVTTTISSRPSKTPPGFRSLDAGQNFYNVPTSQQQQQQHQQQQQQQQQQQNVGQRSSDFSSNNIQKLWRNQNSHTHASSSSTQMDNGRNPVSYVAAANKYNSSEDVVYSFNQYSTYYNPHFHWRKDNTTPTQSESVTNKGSNAALKSLWQDDESYQRYHWFSDSKTNTNKLSVAGNNLTLNKVQNYAYGIPRQAQEVY